MILQRLLELPIGSYKCVRTKVKKRLFLKDKMVDDILGYLYIKKDENGDLNLMTTSHADHHYRLHKFPCMFILYNNSEVKIRSINYMGTFQQVSAPANVKDFDDKFLSIVDKVVKFD